MDEKRVLLLGGTGTLSSAVLKEAMSHGWNVTILNRGFRQKELPVGTNVIIGDFYNISSWIDKVATLKFDVVVDFLSRKDTDIKRVYPLLKKVCKQYIFISSACVYKRDSNDFPLTEDSPKPNEKWNYNVEKYDAERTLVRLAADFCAKFTIVRPYITYDDERIPFGISPIYKYHRTLLERIKCGKPMFVWKNGENVTTLTYVSDFAKGVVGLFLNVNAFNQDFHITSDYHYTWNEFWKILCSKMNVKPSIYNISLEEFEKYLPRYSCMLRGDRALDAIFDNEKIKKAVPTLKFDYSLSEGIDRILKYYDDLESWDYDYEYDALVDRMLSSKSSNCTYVKYKNSKRTSCIVYHLYRYLPYRIALKICRVLKIKK